jgi:hypothetical protein
VVGNKQSAPGKNLGSHNPAVNNGRAPSTSLLSSYTRSLAGSLPTSCSGNTTQQKPQKPPALVSPSAICGAPPGNPSKRMPNDNAPKIEKVSSADELYSHQIWLVAPNTPTRTYSSVCELIRSETASFPDLVADVDKGLFTHPLWLLTPTQVQSCSSVRELIKGEFPKLHALLEKDGDHIPLIVPKGVSAEELSASLCKEFSGEEPAAEAIAERNAQCECCGNSITINIDLTFKGGAYRFLNVDDWSIEDGFLHIFESNEDSRNHRIFNMAQVADINVEAL